MIDFARKTINYFLKSLPFKSPLSFEIERFLEGSRLKKLASVDQCSQQSIIVKKSEIMTIILLQNQF
jgi:hypothetical protein